MILGDSAHLRTRSKPEILRSRGQGTVKVCVDLPPANAPGKAYRVVLFNPDVPWAGVAIIPATDFLRSNESAEGAATTRE